MHDEYYDDTDADYHTTDYIPKMSFDHHEKWHGNEHAWMIMIHYLLLINLHVCNMTPSKIKHNVSVCCLTIMSVYFIDC